MAAFFNQATLSYNGQSVTSNITTGELIDAVTATKTTIGDAYDSDSKVTYIVSLQNTSAAPLTNLTVSDDMGAYVDDAGTRIPLTYENNTLRYYVNGVLQSNLTVTAGPPMVITGVNLPAGANGMLIYEANVNQFAPLGRSSVITNTATVTGQGLVNPVLASAPLAVSNEPILSISKSLSPVTVTENGELTYTFTIENRGNTEADATAGIVVSDTFNPILNPISVSLDGTTLAAPTQYTYNPATGQFATVAGQITVPAATYTQDAANGATTIIPGRTALTVTGTV